MLHRRRFWRDPQRIRAELEKEARSETYIQNTLAMLAARIELIDAYLSGEMTVEKEPEPALDGVAKSGQHQHQGGTGAGKNHQHHPPTEFDTHC